MKHHYAGDYSAAVKYKRGDVVRLPDGRYHVFSSRGFFDVAAPRDLSCIGPQGVPGRDGVDGRDSTVPGPPGRDGADSTVPGPRGPRGPRGRKGEDGYNYSYTRIRHVNDPSGVPVPAIFDSITGKGYVVYVSSSGHVDLAQANADPQARAIGLASDFVQAGERGNYITTGVLENESWNLTPGDIYYLDPDVPGGITATFPTGNGQYVIIIGSAITPTALNVAIHHAVRLGT